MAGQTDGSCGPAGGRELHTELGDTDELRGSGWRVSVCAGCELAERRARTKAPLWGFERGASPSCVVRELSVGKEKWQKSSVRELLEKMSLPLGRPPPRAWAPVAAHPLVGHSLHRPSRLPVTNSWP